KPAGADPPLRPRPGPSARPGRRHRPAPPRRHHPGRCLLQRTDDHHRRLPDRPLRPDRLTDLPHGHHGTLDHRRKPPPPHRHRGAEHHRFLHRTGTTPQAHPPRRNPQRTLRPHPQPPHPRHPRQLLRPRRTLPLRRTPPQPHPHHLRRRT